MNEKENLTLNRFEELCLRARECCTYFFTQFHSPAGASLAYRVANDNEISMWGGMESSERVVVRFGDEREIGYEAEFPIRLIKVEPRAPKFAERLNHRDFLGSLMGLGIERATVGDIVVKENAAYIFVLDTMEEFILENLVQVKHTNVSCSVLEEMPEEIAPVLKPRQVTVSSERMDGVISKLFNLSRTEAKGLFEKELVFADGRPMKNPSAQIKPGTAISVRGHGKFIFDGIEGQTRKGRTVCMVRQY